MVSYFAIFQEHLYLMGAKLEVPWWAFWESPLLGGRGGHSQRKKILLLVHHLVSEITPNQQAFIEFLQNANRQTFTECQ